MYTAKGKRDWGRPRKKCIMHYEYGSRKKLNDLTRDVDSAIIIIIIIIIINQHQSLLRKSVTHIEDTFVTTSEQIK
jgi:hypothetical protein